MRRVRRARRSRSRSRHRERLYRQRRLHARNQTVPSPAASCYISNVPTNVPTTRGRHMRRYTPAHDQHFGAQHRSSSGTAGHARARTAARTPREHPAGRRLHVHLPRALPCGAREAVAAAACVRGPHQSHAGAPDTRAAQAQDGSWRAVGRGPPLRHTHTHTHTRAQGVTPHELEEAIRGSGCAHGQTACTARSQRGAHNHPTSSR